ncbi:SDR family NAD(P)-dependent oxidoreductase [Sorangium sp. So ce134]
MSEQTNPGTTLQTVEQIQAWLISRFAEARGLDPSSIDVREPFIRYGLDSLSAMRLLVVLSRALGRPLPATLWWEHPTIEALALSLSGAAPLSAAGAEIPRKHDGHEPIAVVGMACRLPKAPDLESFWQLLRDGGDAIAEVPDERGWDEALAARGVDPRERDKVRRGGFLDRIDAFDPQFFGIPPREAQSMDPQQRLMLELCWEALEDAGILPGSLKGSATGVFAGAIWSDYAPLLYRGGPEGLGPYTVTGSHHSIIANRISYVLGLEGPSLTLDSACSSGLVTVDLACESLRRGESTLALAGAVNLNILPESALAVARLGALSEDGRCYSFDARANGYVRGEGGGMAVLKTLSRAIADGDRIYCVIRGSAVNNDGASNGLTAPNPRAQEAMLRAAYRRAGLDPAAVQYVEAHGTGTPLGDPMEAKALGAVLGAGRPSEAPLRIGSAKTNVGHLEGAAGIVGFMKVALAIHHRLLPPSLNFASPSPHIPFAELGLAVPTTLGPWPAPERRLVAGVSSFGLGGTNSHVVLEEWPAPRAEALAVCAESPEALRARVQALRETLAADAGRTPLRRLSADAAARLDSAKERLAVVSRSQAQLDAALAAFLSGGPAQAVHASGAAVDASRGVVFVFPGQGAQWYGMGRSLLQGEPVFRATIERCDRCIREVLGWSLIHELTVGRASSRLEDIEVSLPAIISIGIAVAAFWRSVGVEPAAVVGHSTGEIAAAHVAGALDLEDTMRVICAYGRVIARKAGQGGMALVGLPWEQAAEALAGFEGRVFRAIQDSADSTVVAGEPRVLAALLQELQAKGVFCRHVSINVAPHCPLADSLRDELFESLKGIRPRRGSVPLFSEVTGTELDGAALDAAHWVRNFGDPAFFSDAVDALIRRDHRIFLDVGPHAITRHSVEANLRRAGVRGEVLSSLQRGEDERGALLDTLGALYALGVPIRWDELYPAGREGAPAAAPRSETSASGGAGWVLPLSAKTAAGLVSLASAYGELLRDRARDAHLCDIAYTASVRRSHHEHRLAVVGRTREALTEALEAFVRGGPHAGIVRGKVSASARPKVVFVFSGQGSQWPGMGRKLLAEEPVFRRAMEACDALVRQHAGFSLLDELSAPEATSRLGETAVAQSTLFAVEVALSALFASWGVRPDAVIGHSVGEVAAAHVAGALDLAEAVRLVCRRGHVMQRATGLGKMASVALPAEEARRELRGHEDRLSIAAINDPGSVVLSGEAAALEEVVERLEKRQVRCHRLRVDYAFHSPQMDPLAERLVASIGAIEARPTRISMYSTVSGVAVPGEGLDAAYWAENLRAPVQLASAVDAALGDGHQIFVEVGPHPVLSGHLAQCLEARGAAGQVVPSLRRESEERRALLLSLGALYVGGYPVAWGRLYPSGGRCVPLPAYPWQRQRYWIEAARDRADTAEASTCLYQLAWHAAELGPGIEPGGIWLVLTSGTALGQALAKQLEAAGARCVTVGLGEGAAQEGVDLRVDEAREPSAFAPALRAADAAGSPLQGVVCLWGGGRVIGAESPAPDRAEAIALAALHLVQALTSREAPRAPQLWWVTEGAQSVRPGEAVDVAQAPLWGLGRVVMQEHPELGCTLLDLEPGDADAASALWRALCAADDEAQVAWRAGKRHVARLVKAPMARGQETLPPIPAESTVLITGGLGALGLCVARWLWEEHHVQHLVLLGRGAPQGERLAAVEALRERGARVTVAQADVADAAAVRALLAAVPAELPLRGLIHAAGVLDDGVLAQQNAARFARVLAPKVRGAWNLHAETRALPLRFFVLFSSAASVLGTAAQSNYAAANAFLDALAQQRRAEGLPAHSLNWGPWADGGMAETLNAAERMRLRRHGIDTLSSAEGVGLLGQALCRAEAQLCVLPLNLRALRQAFAATAVPPVWRALVEPTRTRAGEDARGGWAAELSALAPEARLAEVVATVRAEAATVLGLGAPGDVPTDRALKELGLSSLMALEMRNALATRLGKALPATLVFNHPTVAALARHLLEQMEPTGATSAALPISAPMTHEEPIAIVGIGCRYPGGVRDLDSFWRLLEQEVDAIGEVPRERWDVDAYYDPDPDAQGKMVTRWGGFLPEVDRFDPGFFDMSPREASGLDPQQRLLLEVSWEALEQAGQTPERLWGSDTGVYVGLSSNEYQAMAKAQAEPLEPHVLLGTMHSTSVARLSYWLGLKGPNMPVDTACSSSLVAVHLACQALRTGECSLALAGGVNLILSPEATVCLSGMRAMSPTGRCHTFSADADGYVRSEGCGVLVLKRLSNATRDGDPILAVIRGSAVNQDGRSNGLTAPSGPSQEAVIRRALAQAGVSPSAVGYVEAHGTGTPLGDPIEVQALSAVLSEGRAPEQPVLLGSVKTNLGHTEAAAGVAGLIKAVLSLQRERIPRSLHFSAPNPHIPWERLPVQVAMEAVPWSANGHRRIAGVSSFGISGTNAHVVVEEAPRGAMASPGAPTLDLILPLSAKSPRALSVLAASYREFLRRKTSEPLGDIAYTASVRRGHHAHRLAVVGRSREELEAGLDAYGRGEPRPGVVQGEAQPGVRPKVVFVCSGQGSQWAGMGQELLEQEPSFREALDACEPLIQRHAGFSLLEALAAPEDRSRLHDTHVAQPALFALQVALSALWGAWGVRPDAVLGHSVGEMAAAHLAGALSLEEAVRLVCCRGRVMHEATGLGTMAAVALPAEAASNALQGHEDRLSIAAVNDPGSVVLAGEPAALSGLVERLRQEGVDCRMLRVNYAFHSPQMAPFESALVDALGAVDVRRAERPIYSTVSGEPIDGEALHAAYWGRNLRAPVAFARAVDAAARDGYEVFVEIGPHPVLSGHIERCLDARGARGVVVHSLRRDREQRRTLLSGLSALYTAGCPVEWKGLYPSAGRCVPLPSYPWQRTRCWIEAERASRGAVTSGHPLLGAQVPVAGASAVFEATLGVTAAPYLSDHRVFDHLVVPGAAVLELAHAAAVAHAGPGRTRVEGLVLQAPLLLPETGEQRVQVVVSEAAGDGAEVTVYSQSSAARPGDGWTEHATAQVQSTSEEVERAAIDWTAVRARCRREVSTADLYATWREAGLAYGPAFQGILELWCGEGEALARTGLPADAGAGADGYAVHPALLDVALQTLAAALGPEASAELCLPFEVDDFIVWRLGATAAWMHARRAGTPGARSDVLAGDITLADDRGEVLAELTGVRLKRAQAGSLRRTDEKAKAALLHQLAWQQVTTAEGAKEPSGTWLVVTGGSALGEALRTRLEAAGARCVAVDLGGEAVWRSAESLRSVLDALDAGGARLEGVVCLWGAARAAEQAPPDRAEALAVAALHGVQALAARQASTAPRLWWVTEGAQAVRPGEAVDVAQAPLWGLGRVVMQEHPELGCTLLDLEPGDADAPEVLWRALCAADDETQVAWRAGKRHVARLVKAPMARGQETLPPIPAESTVLITGGLGALGLCVARWLWEEHHVQHLVLLGRGAPQGERLAAVEALRERGARVTVAQADVADAAAVRALLAAVPAELPLRGLIHAAGVLDDGVLAQQNAARFARVLAPKVRGAWNLHTETCALPLRFFVLFSSAASVLGTAGQSSYAAGNAFLDALAQQRRAEGLPAHSLNWGPWADGGMAETLDALRRTRLIRQGIGWLSPAEGLASLAQALSRPEAQLCVLPLELRALRGALGSTAPPLWRALLPPRSSRASAVAARSWAERLLALAPEARLAEVQAAVRAEVARVLGLGAAADFSPERPLQELGFDSLMAVQLRNALAARLGRRLPATLVFDYPTVAALARHLLDQLQPAATKRAAALPTAPAPRDEPIAIVGIGCRYPGGVRDPESFWRLLEQGVDAIGEVPKERWDIDAYYDPDPAALGKMTTRCGGFLEGVDQFDPSFFGISPREATKIDPQHRLLLEVTWEALERAGQTAEQLLSSDTGVFVGLMYHDYELLNAGALDRLDGYTGSGNAASVASGRISYLLGLKGPSLTLDTACSSSLVAIHLACQSLRSGDCSMALAGGVTLMLTPAVHVEFSRLRGLAADGRCKTFDASADGVAWSEGCGVVVLKRLSDAERDGDPILATIRGSAVNQDGRSNGMSAPNGPSQEAVIRRALAQAGVAPSAVRYVEAHGTGTPLGDPIEVQALSAVLREGRAEDRPVVIGSAKTNFGHSQAAAGAAGLIKVVLALQHGSIPKSLHFRAPNPHIPWEQLPVKVASETVPWPANGAPRIAGVSSFGFSGTNAHVVLEEAPRSATTAPEVETPSLVLPLSAKSPAALSALGEAYRAFLSQDGPWPLVDIAYTASARRTHHAHRLAVVGRSREELAASLEAFGRGEARAGVVQGEARPGAQAKVVFVYPGQGSQWAGMGRRLIEQEPVFRRAMEACDEAVRAEAGFSLLEEIGAEASRSQLDRIDIVQPALFAMGVALSALWRSWGVEPSAVVGHSMGEVAAAHVAGALTLRQAVQIICRRSRLLRRLRGRGAMALLELSLAEAEGVLRGHEDRLSVAASNSPRSTVLSGDPGVLGEVLSRLSQQNVFCRQIKVDVASHSPQMDSLREDLLGALSELSPSPAGLPMYSTVTSSVVEGTELTAEYWVRNLRNPVLFAQSIQRLVEQGHTLFVEMSPHPMLSPAIEEGLRHAERDGAALPSLRREQEERRVLLSSLGALYAHGYPVTWKRLYPSAGRCVPLPAYPFQRERYWIEAAAQPNGAAQRPRASRPDAQGHPLLGASLAIATRPGVHCWEHTLDAEALSRLADHRIDGEVVLSVAAYVEMALSAAATIYGQGAHAVEDVVFERMLAFPRASARTVQVELTEQEPGHAIFQVSSRDDAGNAWVRHATASVRAFGRAEERGAEGEALRAIQARCPTIVAGTAHYEQMRAQGIEYGADFQGVEQLWVGAGEVLGRVRLPDESTAGAFADGTHPALLDACFQVLSGLSPAAAAATDGEGPYVPVSLERVRLERRPRREVWVHGRLRQGEDADERAFRCDMRLVDDEGRLLGEARGFRLQRLSAAALGRREPYEAWLYALSWQRKDAGVEAPVNKAPPAPGALLLWMDRGGTGAALSALLEERGERCVRVVAGERYARLEEGLYEVNPSDADTYGSVLRDAFGDERACRGVMHLWSLDATAAADTTAETLLGDQRLSSLSALYLAQALLRAGFRDLPRLWLVTRGAQAVEAGEGAVAVSQAPLWGLGRTLALEHPELGCSRVDLAPRRGAEEAPALLRELVSGDGEDQIALRQAGRYVARLVRRPSAPSDGAVARPALQPAGDRPFLLAMTEPGVLSRLLLRETERRPPGPDEVEIEVDAASLSFLDVRKALGIYPGPANGPISLGGECAGRIVRVGESVTDVTLGQEVIALGPGSLGSHVTAPARLVMPRPRSLGVEEASSVALVFMTAWYALIHLGRLREGERVLIHSAAGGVGLAAVQIAQRVGAEIFATAGSADKRELLRSMGIRQVMDSRSLAFADEVMASTQGEGVDVVLSSLSGDAIPKSLSVLAHDGRFLDIGQRDIHRDRPLGLRHLRSNLSYTTIDLASLSERKPALFSGLLREVMAELEAGRLKPLPYQRFSASSVEEAFHVMARGQHVGKIVVNMRDPEARIARAAGADRLRIEPDGTYLITGGLGGLGLSVAAWLVREGARHVVLVGRRGASEAARSAIRAMEEAGAAVRVLSADVSQRADVARVLAEIEVDLPPLRGILHAAAVVDDGTVLKISQASFDRVMAPKVAGAWNLHAQTLHKQLSFFVLYSSAASLLGTPGLGSYAAANAFLDALAHHRRGLGLAALSINWGPFSEVGLAVAQELRGERLSHRGVKSLSPAQGLEVLGRLLSGKQTQVGVLDLNLRQWLEFYPSAARSPLFAELLKEQRRSAADAPKASQLRQALEREDPERRRALLEQHLCEQLGRVLHLPPSRIERLAGFSSLGMDSVTSLELRNQLELDLGLRLSATLLFTYSSLSALAEHLLDRMALRGGAGHGASPESPGEPAVDGPEVVDAEQLSDDELLAAFDTSLNRIKTEKLG